MLGRLSAVKHSYRGPVYRVSVEYKTLTGISRTFKPRFECLTRPGVLCVNLWPKKGIGMFFSNKFLVTALVLAVSVMTACGGSPPAPIMPPAPIIKKEVINLQELGRFECSIQSATCFGVEWDRITKEEVRNLAQSLAKNERAANSRNAKGETPLHWAARFGKPYTVGYLLAARANPESRTKDGQTPLHWAAFNRNPDVTWRILDAGRTIHNARDKFGRTALHVAVVKNSNPNVVTMLLRYCVNPLIQDDKKRVAFDLIKDNEELMNTDAYWILRDVVERGEDRRCETTGLPKPKSFRIDE